MTTNDKAQENLRQAADIEQASGWTVARLVASSVKQGKPGPKSRSQDLKLGTNEAASAMGKSHKTITAYLNAWNAAAADGHCTHGDQLMPDDGWSATLPPAELWEQYRQPNSHGTATGSKAPAAPDTSDWSDDQKRQVAAELLQDETIGAEAVTEAIDQNLRLETRARNAVQARQERRDEEHADRRQAAERGRKQREAERSKDAGVFAFQEVNAMIGDVIKAQKQAARCVTTLREFLSTRNFRGDAHDSIVEGMAEVKEMQNNLGNNIDAAEQLAVNGPTDWDAELANITEQE